MQFPTLPTTWKRPSSVGRPALASTIETDVVVIGAGITGLTAALLLQQKGRRVVVVESHDIAAGTSGATTAHLTTDCDHDYSTLEKAYGTEGASLVKTSLSHAIDLIENLAATYSPECNFRRLPGYLFTEKNKDGAWLREEFKSLQNVGMAVEETSDVPVPFPSKLGIRFADQAAFDPTQYLAGLSKAFEAAGGQIFTQTPAVDVRGGAPCYVKTAEGRITAREVILATHTPLGISPLQTLLAPYRSFVMAFRTTSSLPDALFWDTEEPYNYLRRRDRNDPHLLIAGGQDRKTAHGEEAKSFEALEAYVRQRFENVEVQASWSAQFYDPADHVPYIGRAPFSSNLHVATGFSGDGMTFGTLAGWMLAEQLEGKSTPYDDMYHPARVRRSALKDFFLGQVDVATCMVVDRLPKPKKSLSEIGKSEGCVLRAGRRHVAAYRDSSGDLRTYSAVCPHLGGIVRWNETNTSFDCPCHGSRFGVDGSPLEGPSTAGLAPVQES